VDDLAASRRPAHTGGMTRFVIDAPTAIELARRGDTVPPAHSLVAPAVLRSQALQLLLTAVREGRMEQREGRRLLEALAGQRIRLLGDRVSRATAWKVALEAGWDAAAPAEYVAVTMLQADVLVTADPDLRRRAEGRVALGDYDDLLGD
jgi:hypothetical protein